MLDLILAAKNAKHPYSASMENIYRDDKGEHFNHAGWSNQQIRMRSLATDKELLITERMLQSQYVSVTLSSEDKPEA